MSTNANAVATILERLVAAIGMDPAALEPARLRWIVAARCRKLGLADDVAYAGYLAETATELDALIDEVVVLETQFFRDPTVFEHVRQAIAEVAAKVVGPLRVLSAPCGTGQEAYSVAAQAEELGRPRRAIARALPILDVEDLIQTALGRPISTSGGEVAGAPHILIVDDSHTVQEMERRLLVRAGYRVTTAQNGQEAWNLLRLNEYDLLISDVDMPQMNGIELVSKVRGNLRLGRMPVIILSYKDRDEDRQRGLDAGADFYLTKGDFQNENFRQAVVDLIGAAG